MKIPAIQPKRTKLGVILRDMSEATRRATITSASSARMSVTSEGTTFRAKKVIGGGGGTSNVPRWG